MLQCHKANSHKLKIEIKFQDCGILLKRILFLYKASNKPTIKEDNFNTSVVVTEDTSIDCIKCCEFCTNHETPFVFLHVLHKLQKRICKETWKWYCKHLHLKWNSDMWNWRIIFRKILHKNVLYICLQNYLLNNLLEIKPDLSQPIKYSQQLR